MVLLKATQVGFVARPASEQIPMVGRRNPDKAVEQIPTVGRADSNVARANLYFSDQTHLWDLGQLS